MSSHIRHFENLFQPAEISRILGLFDKARRKEKTVYQLTWTNNDKKRFKNRSVSCGDRRKLQHLIDSINKRRAARGLEPHKYEISETVKDSQPATTEK